MSGRREGEDREEAVAHPGLPISSKARLSSQSGRNGSNDGETLELLKKQQQGVN